MGIGISQRQELEHKSKFHENAMRDELEKDELRANF
jgi:hypothetical protein